jgi:hypothetical protein
MVTSYMSYGNEFWFELYFDKEYTQPQKSFNSFKFSSANP